MGGSSRCCPRRGPGPGLAELPSFCSLPLRPPHPDLHALACSPIRFCSQSWSFTSQTEVTRRYQIAAAAVAQLLTPSLRAPGAHTGSVFRMRCAALLWAARVRQRGRLAPAVAARGGASPAGRQALEMLRGRGGGRVLFSTYFSVA